VGIVAAASHLAALECHDTDQGPHQDVLIVLVVGFERIRSVLAWPMS
jgi:hypothetical protein